MEARIVYGIIADCPKLIEILLENGSKSKFSG